MPSERDISPKERGTADGQECVAKPLSGQGASACPKFIHEGEAGSNPAGEARVKGERNIVERLRNDPVDRALCYQAAATIEALRAENERLREVGHDIIAAAYATGATDVHNHWAAGNVEGEADFTESADDYARAALQGGQSND